MLGVVLWEQARYKQEGIPESLLTITATAEDNAKGLEFFVENKVRSVPPPPFPLFFVPSLLSLPPLAISEPGHVERQENECRERW